MMMLYPNTIKVTIKADGTPVTGGDKRVFSGKKATVNKDLKCSVTPLKNRNVNLEGVEHEESQNKYKVIMPLLIPVNLTTDMGYLNCKKGSVVTYMGRTFLVEEAPSVYTNVIPHIEFIMIEDFH